MQNKNSKHLNIMILTVKIDDSLPVGKRIIQELRSYPKVVKFEYPVVTDGVAPEGYMTGEEFARRGKEKLKQYYKENGLLE